MLLMQRHTTYCDIVEVVSQINMLIPLNKALAKQRVDMLSLNAQQID